MEVELGPLEFAKDGQERALVAPSAVVNWGFAERYELVLEGRHLLRLGDSAGKPRSQVQDAALSLKTVLRDGSLQERSGPSIATEVGVLLPAVHGEPGVGGQGALILSHRVPDLTVHLNGGLAWTRTHRLGSFGGVVLEVHDAWAVRPVAEVLVWRERGQPTASSALVGAIWRVRDTVSLDAGYRLGRAAGIDRTEVRAGLTWGFDLGRPR